MSNIRYKVWRHDFGSPVQSSSPIVWDGQVGWVSDAVEVDESDGACGSGWNACLKASDAIRIGGLWPTGRPSILTRVEGLTPWYDRGDKSRTAQIRVVEIIDPADAIRELSQVFGAHAEEMAEAQIRWRGALARPGRDPEAVERGLRAALAARGLNWQLRRFDSARAAWDARAARDAWAAWDARAARDAWDAWAAWDARDAWAAWDARAARDARDAWDAWDARDAWAAWDARAARDAWDALTVRYASRMGWVTAGDLESGLIDAYAAGLEIALPTGPNELGWAMAE